MSTPAEVVQDVLEQASDLIASNQAQLLTFTSALSGMLEVEAQVDVTFAPVVEPSGNPVPARPASLEELEDEFIWDEDGSIAAARPAELVLAAPEVEIDDFTEPDPTVDFGTPPELVFPDEPVVTIGTVPTVPTVADITVPEAPTITLPDTPTYLTLSTPTFAGVDMHEDFLANLENIPELEIIEPTPYSYSPGPEYSSELKTAVTAALLERIAGGTGLPAAVEAAIWDRARDRDAAVAEANTLDVLRQSEALGFSLPTGLVAAQLRKVQDDAFKSAQSTSRDIAIKQAELELANIQATIAQSMQWEGQLIDLAWKLELQRFENAKTYAQFAIETYNSRVNHLNALTQAYSSYATAYRAIIDGELGKVAVFKAEVDAELAKAQVNETLVRQYEAEIRARLAAVEVFRAQVEGAKALVEVETAKVQAAEAAIRGFIAGVNAETAKVEVFKTQVQAQGIKADAYKSGVDAQLATVKVYEAKASAYQAKAGAQGERARALTANYEAQWRAKAAEFDGWRTRVVAEGERFRALGIKSNAALDGYRADIARFSAVAESDSSRWRAQIAEYEATAQYTLQAFRLNSDIVKGNTDRALEAAKVGAQVFAQLSASSYGLINANTSVSASSSNSVGYSYSNETDAPPPSVTVI